MQFDKQIRLLIDIKKITQREFAEALGISDARVSQWLSGQIKKPQRKTLQNISEIFGCDIEWLETGAGEPFPESSTYKKQEERAAPATSESEALKQVRMYRELAQMDADTLGEIQTWLNDMEKLRPGFTGWFRLEFQNRFPEFDEWKHKLVKNSKTGTDN